MIAYTKKQIAELDNYYKHPRNLVDLFEDSVKKWGDRPAMGTKNPGTRKYEWVTYNEIARRVDNLRAGLKKKGFRKNDTVGVIVSNSVEWFVIENAVHGLGGRFVAMYEKELFRTWEYIVKDSRIRFLFVRNRVIFDQVKKFKRSGTNLKDIFVIHGTGKGTMEELEALGERHPVPSYKPNWWEVANIIYTSGTTGDPKGVVLSHGNLSACSQSGYHIYPDLDEEAVSLAILPWAHSYGLSAELHNFLQFGGSIGLMEAVETLAEDFQLVRPTYLIAVPRVFNKIYDGIMTSVNEAGGVKKLLFNAACREAVKCRGRKSPTLKMKVLDSIVFSKIRERFGGRIRGVMTASAVMNPEIAMFFKDIGVPTYDCFGLTETSPAITMNSPLKGNKYGSVGQCVENMHVKIDKSRVTGESEDGEIIAYGAHVMMGYLNKPKETAAVFVKDTWNGFRGIRTGDQGRLDKDGYLYVTGRFKDEYKLTNGKYIHPESIETDMKLLNVVANAMIYGEGREYNVAIVVPDFEVIRRNPVTAKWAAGGPRKMIYKPELTAFLVKAITEHLKKSYAAYEIPKKFVFINDDFTLENGMLTQTMKVKRREIMKMYGTRLLSLYEEE